MKTKFANKERGIVLPVTLGVILVVCIILVAYSSLLNSRNLGVARAQGWNEAIPVLEGGVEEALTQLQYAGTNSGLLTSNNWTYGADGLYHKTRTLPNGSYYNVSIQPAVQPIILSTGYVQVVDLSSTNATNYISRKAKVIAKAQPPGGQGVNAKGQITFNGSGSLADSFNSTNSAYSTGGQYDPTKFQQNVQVLTDSTNAGAINTGTGTIYGSAVTGGGGTVSGTVTAGSTSDANVQFNDVAAPFPYGTATTPASGSYSIGGTNYNYSLSSGNYNMSSLSLSGNGAMIVTGNATLFVNGSLSLTGSSYLYLAPGSSLNLYVNGSADFGGGGVLNGTTTASNFWFYGMPACTSLSIHGGTYFTGVTYAPNASTALGGGTSVVGAITISSLTVSGGSMIHYDSALDVLGTKDYAVVSWNEL